MFQINNKNTRRCHRRRSGVFIVNLEYIHIFFCNASIVEFEQIIAEFPSKLYHDWILMLQPSAFSSLCLLEVMF